MGQEHKTSTDYEVLKFICERALQYLNGLESRKVVHDPVAVTKLAVFDESLPENPSDSIEVLDTLDRIGSPATIASAGSRFFGFVIGGSRPEALAANWLTSTWDQNSAYYDISPVAAKLENIALRWLLQLFNLPSETAGAFITGATMANFTALAAARSAVLAKAGWDVENNGLQGSPAIRIIAGEEAHPTLFKALMMLGFGRSQITRIPVDNQGRMKTEAISYASEPTIICAQAGNINTGAFDNFDQIHSQSKDLANCWLHVDGAFGLWAQVVPSLQHLCTGIEKADSWATDGHKWLNVPYDNGFALVRNSQALRKAMAISAEYLPQEGTNRNPSEYTPELSRRGRGIEIWATLRCLGRSGLIEMIEGCCRHAQHFAEALSGAGLTILNDVVLNQVLVSFGDEKTTRRIIREIQSDGTCWCGGTNWQGHPAMRISICSWATAESDVEKSITAIINAVRKIKG